MRNLMNDSIERVIGAPIRKRDDRDRCIEALQLANARGPGNLKVPALRRLLEFPKEEFTIIARKIFDAINAVVAGEQPGLGVERFGGPMVKGHGR
jgi:hypothetical protein